MLEDLGENTRALARGVPYGGAVQSHAESQLSNEKIFRRTVLAALTLAVAAPGLAQDYPNKPIRLVIGFSPGGSSDVVARVFAQRLSASLGQPVVVENRVGAGGTIAADLVAKAEPDGYRLFLQNSGTFDASVLSKNIPYNVLRDFTPVAYIAAVPLILVAHPSVPARTVTELVQLAKTKPGELTYGSEGLGGSSHLTGELLGVRAKIRMTHVPYKSAVQSSAGVAAGDITLNIAAVTSALPLLRAEKYRAIAVTSLRRSQLLPNIPTLDESGFHGFDRSAWFGVVGPAGMPKNVVDRLHAALAEACNAPEVRETLKNQGVDIDLRPPERFAEFMRDTATQIQQMAKEVSLKLD